MNRSGIGVVIATRNRARSLRTTLHELTSLPETPEIVVVDNASDDDTRTMVETLFPRVRLLRLPANQGALARTQGVRLLDTPVVAFSDDDSWWAPGALHRAERLMRDHPRLGLIAARTLVGKDNRPDPINTALAGSPLLRRTDLPGPSVLGFLCCAAVVRRDAFLDVDGFHPLLFFGGEESLLAYDLAAHGWGVAHCPDVVAHHHPAPSQRTGREAALLRNMLLTAWLRRPLPVALRHTLSTAVAAREDRTARRALRATLARLPAALARRRLLPADVEADIRLLESAHAPATPVPTAPPPDGPVTGVAGHDR
ncbi:glycosyltransferase [Streptomyces sp. NPDC026206]|uniref:glycosyltransferase family 2 protein n=1 Tax=Streptomyces sp. NPDC026206 TaxID=3157089 RepID=UPI0033E96D12